MLSDATRLLTSSPNARPAHSDAILWPEEVFGKDSLVRFCIHQAFWRRFRTA